MLVLVICGIRRLLFNNKFELAKKNPAVLLIA